MRRPLPLFACLTLSCLAVACGGDASDGGSAAPKTPATTGPTAGLDPDAKVIAHSRPTVTFEVAEPAGGAGLPGSLDEAKAAADGLITQLPGEEFQGLAQQQVDQLATQAEALAQQAKGQLDQLNQQAQGTLSTQAGNLFGAGQGSGSGGASVDDALAGLGGLLGGGAAADEVADVSMSTAEDGSVTIEGITIPTAAQAQAAAEAEVNDANADALLAELLAALGGDGDEDG